MTNFEEQRFPIGRFSAQHEIGAWEPNKCISAIAELPAQMKSALNGLTDEQLDTPYRSGGWTVRQVAHHLPDSHLNSYCRFKLTLTEDEPTIKPYEEALWANLPDSKMPVAVSIDLLESLHVRWVALLKSLSDTQLNRGFRHPEAGRVISLKEALGLYAWHGLHHLAHITNLKKEKGW
jgi:hypothetical protein